ncbi:MAG: hypothetical protein J5497_00905, partial [Selenomonadaceae bacterium]|nr:hypothetical protein [Selenomonadaceae bacterium]
NIIIKHFPSWRKKPTEETIVLANAVSLASVNILGRIDKGANISNITSNIVISGTSANDTIFNGRRGVLLNSAGSNVTINARAGNDFIENTGAPVSISGGDGNDTIWNAQDYSTIDAGAGNDSIYSRRDGSIIDGGAGNDNISVFGGNNSINAGAGSDYVNVEGVNNTINAGEGSDYISLSRYSRKPLIQYAAGDGSDDIYGFSSTSTLMIAGADFTTQRSEYNSKNIVVNVGKSRIVLYDAASLKTVNIVKDTREFPLNIANADSDISLVGTSLDDTISNSGNYVTISAADGNDSISNNGKNVTIDGGAGDDSIVNDYGFYASIAGGDGNDAITVLSSSQATINAGAADDVISLKGNDETFIEYNAGDGNDKIYGFDKTSTLNIVKNEFTSAISGNDVVVTVGKDKITLDGAASLSNPNIVSGTHATFTVKNSEVTCDTDLPDSVIKDAYRFNKELSLLTINGDLQDYLVTVKNDESASVKVNWNAYGTASLNSGSTLEYQLDYGQKTATLLSKNFNDQIAFSEDVSFNYGRIQADVLKNSTVSAKGAKKISFRNDSCADVRAPRDYQIDVDASDIVVNDLPINAKNGSGTITVKKDGLSFEGYGAQLADLEVAKESYFGKLAPMTVDYN